MSVRLITRLIANGQFLPVVASLLFNKLAPALLIPAYIFFVPVSTHEAMQNGLKSLFGLAQNTAQIVSDFVPNLPPPMAQNFSQIGTGSSEKNVSEKAQKLADESPNFLDSAVDFVSSVLTNSAHQNSTQQQQQIVKNETDKSTHLAQKKAIDLSWAVGQDVQLDNEQIVKLNQFGGCTIRSETSGRIPASYVTCPSVVLQMLIAQSGQ